MARASLERDPQQVAAMFDGVAPKYDRTNTVLSGGQDLWWRRVVRRTLDPRPGERVLDVAAGTAVSSASLARSGATVVACDFSLGMLRAGRHRGIALVAGDALHLPFADATFDAVTISFGLRNVVDTSAALEEFARVTKPAGRLLVCEFSQVTVAPLRRAYLTYLKHGLPRIAGLVSSAPDAYSYLTESIEAWPDQQRLAELIAAAGWRRVGYRNLSLGAVALHHALR